MPGSRARATRRTSMTRFSAPQRCTRRGVTRVCDRWSRELASRLPPCVHLRSGPIGGFSLAGVEPSPAEGPAKPEHAQHNGGRMVRIQIVGRTNNNNDNNNNNNNNDNDDNDNNTSADPLMSASLKQGLSETLRVSEKHCLIFEALSDSCFAYMSYL